MKILIAVDGSRYSEESLNFLSRFPFAERPDVLLLHVAPIPDYFYTELGIPVDMSHVLDLAKKDGERILKEMAAKCQSWAQSVATKLVSDTVPGQAIIKVATDAKSDLIAVGARGMGAIERFLIGSVSDAVAKHAPCSVLVVRPSKADHALKQLKILIADDGSSQAALAIKRISELRLNPESKILLMTVVNTFHAYHAEYTLRQGPELTTLLNKTQERLDRNAELLKATMADVQTLIKESAEPSKRILNEVDQFNPDLTVVGSTGKSGWKRALLGSVSARVLEHSTSSVWIERDKISGSP